jgi:glucokinase
MKAVKKYIGADIGGTNLACGIVDENGVILHKDSVKTESEKGCESVIGRLADLIKSVAAGHEIEALGAGCPGVCNQITGEVEVSPNLNWNNVPLRAELQRLTGYDTSIDNDANAAAYGEFAAGAAKGANSAVVITLGTGVGSGIIIGGKLFRGENFAGGELGHVVVQAGGELCSCGRRGCFEAYSSATALIRMTREAMAANPSSAMHAWAEEYGKVSARTAWACAKSGDSAGQAVVDMYIEYLACGITNVINIFQPDIVCIGGGVCGERERLLEPLKKLVGEQVYSRDSSAKNSEIAICELGNDAGIIGAALV